MAAEIDPFGVRGQRKRGGTAMVLALLLGCTASRPAATTAPAPEHSRGLNTWANGAVF